MMKIHAEPLVRFSVGHPWLVILLALAVTAGFFSQLPGLETEPDVESLLPDGTAAEEYDKLAVMVRGEGLFTPEGLGLFADTFRELETALTAERVIDPFSRVTLIRSGTRLKPVSLAPGGIAPAADEDLSVFLENLERDRFAPGLLTSRKRDVLCVYLFIPKGGSYLEQELIIDRVIAPLREAFEVAVTGTIPFSARTESYLTREFSRLLVFVVLTILASYYIGFRSRRAVFLPVILVMTGTVWSLGVMALAGFKLTMVSIVSPPLVLTLGSSYSIHILNEYYRCSVSRESKSEMIIHAVSGVSGTVIMASLTTLTGLLCLLLASIEQTREFALITGFGILSTAFLSLSLFPAFLVLQPPMTAERLNKVSYDLLSRGLRKLGPLLVGMKKTSLAVFCGLAAAFLYLSPGISFNTSPTSYFPGKSKVIREMATFSRTIGGLDEMTVILRAPGGEGSYFLEQEVLEQVYSLEQKLLAMEDVSHLISFPSYASFAGKIMRGSDGDFSSRGLIRLVSKLFNQAEGEIRLADREYSEIRLFLRIYNSREARSIDEEDTLRILNEIEGLLDDSLPEEIGREVSGLSLHFLALSRQMRSDFIRSTLAALLAIGVLTTLSFRSLSMGLMTLVPLLTGIFASFILMALFRIPLDMTTIMVSCLAIGVGVDDAIHFLLQYRRQSKIFPGDPVQAVSETLSQSGRPIVLTTLSIVSGLLFLTLARFQPIRYFGLLIVFTLSSACLATLFLLPPFLVLEEQWRNKHKGVPGNEQSDA